MGAAAHAGRSIADRGAGTGHRYLERQPPPGLVHHSDRGGAVRVRRLRPSLAAVAWDHREHEPSGESVLKATPVAESFMKTLKREEIYANQYRDMEHLLANIEEFIEQYYNRRRVHSALGCTVRRRSSSAMPARHGAWRGSDPEFFQAWGDLSRPMVAKQQKRGSGRTTAPGSSSG